jgi:hypothetical protein
VLWAINLVTDIKYITIFVTNNLDDGDYVGINDYDDDAYVSDNDDSDYMMIEKIMVIIMI